MRVLVFSSKHLPVIGGVEVFLGHLLPVLHAAGYDVHVVTSAADGAAATEEIDGVTVHRLPLERALLARDLRATLATQQAVAEIRRAYRPDVVHVQDSDAAGWMQLRTRRHDPAPVVLTVHVTREQMGMEGGATSALGAMLRDADRLVAVSDAVRDDISGLEPARRDEIEVIPNAVPLPVVDPSPAPLDAARLLMLGRLTRQKGFDVGLRAFAVLAASSARVGLEIAGAGPEEGPLRELAAELGVADRVTWLGALRGAEPARAVDRASLLVMPSRFEGFPLVALEAAGHGRVVVGTRARGLDEAVVDGVTGVLVPIDDADALASAIASLLADRARVDAMGRAARQRAISECSFERCVAAHDALYRSLARD